MCVVRCLVCVRDGSNAFSLYMNFFCTYNGTSYLLCYVATMHIYFYSHRLLVLLFVVPSLLGPTVFIGIVVVFASSSCICVCLLLLLQMSPSGECSDRWMSGLGHRGAKSVVNALRAEQGDKMGVKLG